MTDKKKWSAEEAAEAMRCHLVGGGRGSTQRRVDAVTVALRQAFDAALEEAALMLESWQARANLDGNHRDHDIFRDLAKAIRARKKGGE